MDDLISRQAAIEAIASRDETNGTVKVFTGRQVNEILESLPSADRPSGHWIDIDTQTYTWKVRCNKCGHERSMMSTQGVYPKFCENCGADMRGEQDE